MFNKVTLDLQEKSYQIIVGSNVIEHLKAFLEINNYNKIIVISDENVVKLHGEKLKNIVQSIDFVIVKAGENAKSFVVFEKNKAKKQGLFIPGATAKIFLLFP